jgi:hypothetical protein
LFLFISRSHTEHISTYWHEAAVLAGLQTAQYTKTRAVSQFEGFREDGDGAERSEVGQKKSRPALALVQLFTRSKFSGSV